ncbi:hypothetical protein Ddc_01793 [Ditylenchus destructor]|nr:hypothetical protein Ddc_01793 [Ditylenchus destructor]
MSGPIQRTVHILPSGGKLKIVDRERNDDSSGSSSGGSPDPVVTIDEGGSLTLAQFVALIETRSGQTVGSMRVVHRHRNYNMPVSAPQENADRFAGHGAQLVEDVVDGVIGRVRRSVHGIIVFDVEYVNVIVNEVVHYHY